MKGLKPILWNIVVSVSIGYFQAGGLWKRLTAFREPFIQALSTDFDD
jgi:hypothetical protein